MFLWNETVANVTRGNAQLWTETSTDSIIATILSAKKVIKYRSVGSPVLFRESIFNRLTKHEMHISRSTSLWYPTIVNG